MQLFFRQMFCLRRTTRLRTACAALATVSLTTSSSCSDERPADDELSIGERWEPRSTWEPKLAAVVAYRCGDCHAGDGPARQRFKNATDLDQAREAIAAAVGNRTMPPWGPSADCMSLAPTRVLTSEEKERILKWASSGLPLSASFNASPAATAAMPLPDLTLTLPLAAIGSLDDINACIHTLLPFDATRFVYRARVLTEHPLRLHHASLFAGPPGARQDGCPDMRTLLGGAGIGTPPMTLPDGVGAAIEANDALGLELHYAAPTSTESAILSDSLKVELWLYPAATPPDFLWTVATATAPDFIIPAGNADFPVVGEIELAPNQRAIGFIPHLHALGRSIRQERVTSDGTNACVGAINSWAFDHQDAYFFAPAERFETGAGERLRVTCAFDNSLSNQRIVDGHQTEPVDVRTGWLARDEMCMGSLIVEVPR